MGCGKPLSDSRLEVYAQKEATMLRSQDTPDLIGAYGKMLKEFLADGTVPDSSKSSQALEQINKRSLEIRACD